MARIPRNRERLIAGRGFCNEKALPKGPNGRALCRWCQTEVQPPRLTFCSQACVHEWKLRSDPNYLRVQVWQRDRGICQGCGCDLVARYLQGMVDRHVAWCERAGEPTQSIEFERRIAYIRRQHETRPVPGHLWQADHIVPVVEGGGACGLDNVRVLCTDCHKAATASLAGRRARKRKR